MSGRSTGLKVSESLSESLQNCCLRPLEKIRVWLLRDKIWKNEAHNTFHNGVTLSAPVVSSVRHLIHFEV